jgi:hypothetical protein
MLCEECLKILYLKSIVLRKLSYSVAIPAKDRPHISFAQVLNRNNTKLTISVKMLFSTDICVNGINLLPLFSFFGGFAYSTKFVWLKLVLEPKLCHNSLQSLSARESYSIPDILGNILTRVEIAGCQDDFTAL